MDATLKGHLDAIQNINMESTDAEAVLASLPSTSSMNDMRCLLAANHDRGDGNSNGDGNGNSDSNNDVQSSFNLLEQKIAEMQELHGATAQDAELLEGFWVRPEEEEEEEEEADMVKLTRVSDIEMLQQLQQRIKISCLLGHCKFTLHEAVTQLIEMQKLNEDGLPLVLAMLRFSKAAGDASNTVAPAAAAAAAAAASERLLALMRPAMESSCAKALEEAQESHWSVQLMAAEEFVSAPAWLRSAVQSMSLNSEIPADPFHQEDVVSQVRKLQRLSSINTTLLPGCQREKLNTYTDVTATMVQQQQDQWETTVSNLLQFKDKYWPGCLSFDMRLARLLLHLVLLPFA